MKAFYSASAVQSLIIIEKHFWISILHGYLDSSLQLSLYYLEHAERTRVVKASEKSKRSYGQSLNACYLAISLEIFEWHPFGHNETDGTAAFHEFLLCKGCPTVPKLFLSTLLSSDNH